MLFLEPGLSCLAHHACLIFQFMWPVIIITILLAVLIAGTGIFVVFSLRQRGPEDRTQPALELLNQTVQNLNRQVTSLLSDSSRSISDRLDNTNAVVGDLRQKLGRLEEASRQMMDVGKDIARLQDLLQPPKLRGSMGELFLQDLLAQVLPSRNFELQYRFKGGEAVDAVIRLAQGLVPVDAKFPLENFRRIIEASSDEEKKGFRKAFIRDVKTHIDAISSKYIRMDENTLDFALMYIPAENVYYETIIRDEDPGQDLALFSYAIARRVIPVSPNTFYAYLQTIFLGLRGMRVEEKSREILENIARLQKEFERFAETFRLVGQHLDNSSKKFAEAQKRFGALEAKIDQMDGLAKGLDAVEAPEKRDLISG